MNFNLNDPWHANAHLVFGFQCQNCDAEISVDDFPDIVDFDKEFLEYCIQASNLAKSRGWKLNEDFSFLCPTCNCSPNPSFKRDA